MWGLVSFLTTCPLPLTKNSFSKPYPKARSNYSMQLFPEILRTKKPLKQFKNGKMSVCENLG